MDYARAKYRPTDGVIGFFTVAGAKVLRRLQGLGRVYYVATRMLYFSNTAALP